jgi:hypothetical protein
MLGSRHGHGSSLDFAVRGSKLLDGSKTAAAKFARDGISAGEIGIDHTNQPHGLTLLHKLVVNTCVIPAEGAYTDNGKVDEILRAQIISLSERMIKP